MARDLLPHVLSWRDLAFERGLRPPGRAVLSLDPTGDAALDALARGAERVVLVAPRGARRALVDLKIAAARELPVQSVRSFFGLGDFGRRVWFYHHLRGALPPEARAWWDAREDRVRGGLAASGAFGAALDRFRRLARPAHRSIEALFSLAPGVDRAAWLDRHLDGVRWRAAVAAWWRLDGASAFGAGPAASGGAGESVAVRVRRGLVRHSPADGPFARRWLLGAWPAEGNGAAWLDPMLLPRVREALPRLEVVADFPAQGAFDEVDADAADAELLERSSARVATGGCLVVWGLERVPPLCAPGMTPDPTLATVLLGGQRALFWGGCAAWRRG